MFKQVMMTAVLLIIFSTSNSKALALTGIDSWKSIRASHDVFIQQPAFAGVFGNRGLFNACVTENEFKSLVPVKTCLSNGCIDFEVRDVVVKRVYNNNLCVKFDQMSFDSSGACVEYDLVKAIYPTSFMLPILEANGEQSGSHIFSKKYSVPACD